jgi:lipopolysaccharide/colanic/teichoic acid biosynthesis glycosyltransferase
LKRLFDLINSLLLLIFFSPVFLVVAFKIKNKLGSPIFFKQDRPGLNGKPFQIIKFRTMLDSVDGNGKQLPDSERLTSFGRILRSTSLDELPELW